MLELVGDMSELIGDMLELVGETSKQRGDALEQVGDVLELAWMWQLMGKPKATSYSNMVDLFMWYMNEENSRLD